MGEGEQRGSPWGDVRHARRVAGRGRALSNSRPGPVSNENEKTDFIESVRARNTRTLEDAEVGHRASTAVQLAYIACLLGRKLTWDPVKEQFPNDEEANKLVRGRPGLPPWTIP